MNFYSATKLFCYNIGLAKKLFGGFHKILQKNLNKFLASPTHTLLHFHDHSHHFPVQRYFCSPDLYMYTVPTCSILLRERVIPICSYVFGHLMRRADSFEKTLMLGKIEGRRRGDDKGWDGWMASSTQWTWVWVNSGSWWWTGRPGVLRFMGSQRVGHDWATELNWTEIFSLKPSSVH